MSTKEMIDVMQAYIDGKEVELSKDGETWAGLGSFEPSWDWPNFDYRIKPEPKYVPYDSAEDVNKDKWVKNKAGGCLSRIIGIDSNDVLCVHLDFGWISLKELFGDYTYEDGTPCGKQVKL